MLEKLEHFIGKPDPRMVNYPLLDNVEKTVAIVLIYLLFVVFIGPAWMKNKKPFQLRIPMIIYNIGMVAASTLMFLTCGFHGWFGKYSLRCQPIDHSNSEDALKVAHISWVFYISKLIELSDTIFFVLRKKDSQINFLHLFHHSTVPISVWYGANYGPVGYNTLFPFANTFVHIWMYLYYGLAAIGPGMQKYLWWKKYLTTLQLVQFIMVIVYYSQLYLFPPKDCRASQFLIWLSLGQAILYLFLFLNFYINTYKKKTLRNLSTSGKPSKDMEAKNGNAHSIRKKLHRKHI